MKNSIYIDMHASRTKVAVIEGDSLVELHVERENSEKLIGNIYKGRVENVLSGMQSAFVNIGLSKNAFLYVHENSMVDSSELVNSVPSAQPITDKVGDEIMVQVVKEQFGTKGVRITKDITIPGRYVVLMPKNDYVGISRKITDEEIRDRLSRYVDAVKVEGMGYIVRTAAKNATFEEIEKEAKELYEEYKLVLKNYEKAKCGQLVRKESNLVERMLRDIFNEETEELYINNKEVYEELKERFSTLMPHKLNALKLYSEVGDMFDAFDLNDKMEEILKRKVPLSNGAYLIIDRAEAFTVIDVNTGRYVGENNHEETVFITNMIAVDEIARQLRLRNLGGIIIVDFIDMDMPEHRDEVLNRLKEAVKKDRVKTMVIGMTSLGLVEITRKKTISMVDKVFLQTCPYCDGDSYVYSEEFIIMKLRGDLYKHFKKDDCEAVIIKVNPSVFSKLFVLRTLEQDCQTVWVDKRIYIVPDERLHIQNYDIQSCRSGVIDLPNTARMLY